MSVKEKFISAAFIAAIYGGLSALETVILWDAANSKTKDMCARSSKLALDTFIKRQAQQPAAPQAVADFIKTPEEYDADLERLNKICRAILIGPPGWKWFMLGGSHLQLTDGYTTSGNVFNHFHVTLALTDANEAPSISVKKDCKNNILKLNRQQDIETSVAQARAILDALLEVYESEGKKGYPSAYATYTLQPNGQVIVTPESDLAAEVALTP